MTNFLPLKRYFFYCLDKGIEQYALTPPFLDVGCGIGDLSAYMGRKGWHGIAIDCSATAIKEARENLREIAHVEVKRMDILGVNGMFHTVFLWDVLEHMEHDDDALRRIANLLVPKGHLVMTVPSNPREWRWDDNFYGHRRRYTIGELRGKLTTAGLDPLCAWEVFFPLFWIMRRIYTTLWRVPPVSVNREERTRSSATTPAWGIPILSPILNRALLPLCLLYRVQFLFRNCVERGSELFVVARKRDGPV